ncbi:MAG: pyridoxamine 5'-phosphate oxidase family protein [Dehalococcoidia bacterium]
MSVDLKDQIVEYIEKCRFCAIATASTEGEPSISTVFFKNIGASVYFNTGRETQKVQNIMENPRVAIAMQEAGYVPEADRDIKGIQYIGKAEILSDANIDEVPPAVMSRHRAFNSVKPDNSVIIKVTPVRIYQIDYARGFRHRDLLEF